MAKKDLDVQINAKDKTAQAFTSAKKNLLDFNGNITKIGKSFASAFTWTAIAAGAAKAIGFVTDSFKEFAQAEVSMMKFNATFANNMNYNAKSLNSFAESFSRAFGQDDGAIRDLQVFLATSGRTEDQIKKLITVGNAYSLATGKDLKSAVEELNKTFSGSEGKLGTIIPGMKDLTDEELKQGKAVEELEKIYGHLNDEVGTLSDTKIKALGSAWGDLAETVGSVFKPVIDQVLVELTNGIDKINEEIRRARGELSPEEKIAEIEKTIIFKQDTANEAGAMAKKIRDAGKKVYGDAWIDMYNNWADIAVVANREIVALRDQISYLNAQIEPIKLDVDTGTGTITPTGSVSTGTGTGSTPTVDPWSDDVLFGIKESTTYLFEGIEGLSEEEDKLYRWFTSQEYLDYLKDNENTTDVSANIPQYGSFGWTPEDQANQDAGSILGSLIAPLSDFIGSISSIQAILDPISTIMNGFMQTMGPAINQTIKPLMDALTRVGTILAEALFPILNALAPIFTILANILLSQVMAVLDLFAPAIEWIAGVLQVTLTPILKGVAVALEVLRSPIQYLGDLFKWVAETIKISAHNLSEIMDHPFNEDARDVWTNTAFSSDAFTGLGARIAAIWNQDYQGTLTPGQDFGTAQGGGAGATYTGAKNITMNFYNNAPIVGDSGIRGLAVIVKNELEVIERYA